MLSSQIDQAERRAVLRNDAKVSEQQREQEETRSVYAPGQSLPKQATTFHQHALADAETPRGRFSAVSAAYVVGSEPIPRYPQASGPFQHDPVPDEPPLGLDNPALDPGPDVSPAQATAGPFAPPAGPGTGDPALGPPSPASSSRHRFQRDAAGSSSFSRRRL